MVDLSKKRCQTHTSGSSALEGEVLSELMEDLGGGWNIVNEHHLEKEFSFKDFKEALIFTNKVGAIAEEEQHHPDIVLSYGKVRICLWTHKLNGLSENDFVLAAKIDQLV